jgi:basic membrane lipoprotein Med (substrate-binding protein (PBP1-ABC) superfamily)
MTYFTKFNIISAAVIGTVCGMYAFKLRHKTPKKEQYMVEIDDVVSKRINILKENIGDKTPKKEQYMVEIDDVVSKRINILKENIGDKKIMDNTLDLSTDHFAMIRKNKSSEAVNAMIEKSFNKIIPGQCHCELFYLGTYCTGFINKTQRVNLHVYY